MELLEYEESYREHGIPLLYLARNCENAARMMEEATIYQEEVNRVKKMERVSDYFFQVQRTRLVSLEPIDSPRKWETFRRIVNEYNLGVTGDCGSLNDYIDEKGRWMMETVYGEKGTAETGKLQLPGNEKFVAELINRFNQLSLKQY
jgi:hypothetical protein